jgi:hypothetical protein
MNLNGLGFSQAEPQEYLLYISTVVHTLSQTPNQSWDTYLMLSVDPKFLRNLATFNVSHWQQMSILHLLGTPQTSIALIFNLSNWVLGDILYIEGGDHNLNLIANLLLE